MYLKTGGRDQLKWLQNPMNGTSVKLSVICYLGVSLRAGQNVVRNLRQSNIKLLFLGYVPSPRHFFVMLWAFHFNPSRKTSFNH